MARKSNTLKEAVAASEAVEPVVSEAPAKRGPKPKEVKAVDTKALTKQRDALIKEANNSEKLFRKAVEDIRKNVAKQTTEVRNATLGPLEKAVKDAEKVLQKATGDLAKASIKLSKDINKLESTNFKEIERLTKAKEKADTALAKQIAALDKQIGGTTE